MQSIRDRLLEKAARSHLSIMSSFELLPVCNLNCKMCYVRKSMDDVRNCLETQLKEDGVIENAKY